MQVDARLAGTSSWSLSTVRCSVGRRPIGASEGGQIMVKMAIAAPNMFLMLVLRSVIIARARPSPKPMQLQKHHISAYRVSPRDKQGMTLARARHARDAGKRLARGAPIHGASMTGSDAAGQCRHRASGPSFAFHARSRGLQM